MLGEEPDLGLGDGGDELLLGRAGVVCGEEGDVGVAAAHARSARTCVVVVGGGGGGNAVAVAGSSPEGPTPPGKKGIKRGASCGSAAEYITHA